MLPPRRKLTTKRYVGLLFVTDHGISGAGAPGPRNRAASLRRPATAAAGLLLLLTLTAAAAPGATAGGHGASPSPRASAASPDMGTARRMPVGGALLGRRGVVVNYPAHRARKLPQVRAAAWVVADAATGQVLAAKNAHRWYRPASTLKVLTAITLMPRLDRHLKVRATGRAAGMEPSKVGLVKGRRYRVTDLFRALLLISANDAAVSLAQATGSYHIAIAMMNTEARHLQADDTVAKTPNGLDARGQHVSAYDEALFDRQALSIPPFMRIEKLRMTRFPLRRRHSVKLYNQNTMLQTFPGDLGGKIGWTTPAGATFNGWARRGGHTLVVTLLHCPSLTEMQSAAKLLSWGFAMDGRVRPVGRLVSPLPAAPARHARPAGPPRRVTASVSGRGSLAGMVAIGAGSLVAAGALGSGITVALRRRRAGSRPAP